MFDAKRLTWPTNGDINSWADYIEILCLLNNDRIVTLEDFQDFLLDDASKSIEEILTAINFNEEFLTPLSVVFTLPFGALPPPVIAIGPDDDEDDQADDEVDDYGNNDNDKEDNENADKEKIRSRLLTLFNFLKARKQYFAEYYPFTVPNADTSISVTTLGEQTALQKLYQVLLFSSQMQLYAPADINRIGHMFEALCKRPFSQMVPAIAEKRFFGAGGGEIIEADYTGNLRQKIKSLANNLNVDTNNLIDDPDEIGTTGDAGLDWVGWVEFEDDCSHQPIYFGQCACGSNWVDKQHETSLSRWRNFLVLDQSVQCFHFMPRSFRRTSLEWFRRSKIQSELTLIDRYRLLKIFSLEEQNALDETISPYMAILLEAEAFSYA